jgi:hypothetical protein
MGEPTFLEELERRFVAARERLEAAQRASRAAEDELCDASKEYQSLKICIKAERERA